MPKDMVFKVGISQQRNNVPKLALGSTGTWHQHLGAFQTAWHFTTHRQPIGKTGRKNRERKATQGIGMIYVNKSIPVPHSPA
jgi:hypothetical protein